MRTTLDIDSDVLEAAKEISAGSKRTTGQVISDLARKALTSTGSGGTPPTILNGFEQLPSRGEIVTVEFVRKLIEETEDT
ncbi:hypothetical protein [Luteolibacter sp. Populi]|uniref:hypothetical protein n=1 Tax=Luteolibacter sp. Populi TaxID=3230487 RepID=UPI003467A44C